MATQLDGRRRRPNGTCPEGRGLRRMGGAPAFARSHTSVPKAAPIVPAAVGRAFPDCWATCRHIDVRNTPRQEMAPAARMRRLGRSVICTRSRDARPRPLRARSRGVRESPRTRLERQRAHRSGPQRMHPPRCPPRPAYRAPEPWHTRPKGPLEDQPSPSRPRRAERDRLDRRNCPDHTALTPAATPTARAPLAGAPLLAAHASRVRKLWHAGRKPPRRPAESEPVGLGSTRCA